MLDDVVQPIELQGMDIEAHFEWVVLRKPVPQALPKRLNGLRRLNKTVQEDVDQMGELEMA